MWLKNDGVILAEILLSLSSLLMICLFFLPLWSNLTNQTLELQIEKYAYQLMYEELEAQITNGSPSSNHSTIQNGIEYQIEWSQAADEQMKVCVKVEKNTITPGIKICALSE